MTAAPTTVVAVDLGATSIRVARVDIEARPVAVDVVHRYAHGTVDVDGVQRWDWSRLVAEVERGLEAAIAKGHVSSIGIDTWGVDYGLLDANGALVAPPVSYRDPRTDGWRSVVDRIGAERLYGMTGIQLMAVNTIFQLAAHDRRELDRAHRLLLLPELLLHHLTGKVTAERTSAGTTVLVDVSRGAWSATLLDTVGVDPGLFAPIAEPGTAMGWWRGIPVHLVGGHDTASAVVARSGVDAFVATGSWLLVGAERVAPDTSDAARVANFSNEPAAFGGVRFLKNVMGFWLLERCRAQWGDPPLDELVAAAGRAARPARFDASDQRFLTATDMEAEVRAAATLPATAGRDAVTRCILDSLAATTAAVVAELAPFVGAPVRSIDVLGGGAQNRVFVQALEEGTGVEVRTGAAEATALGNALVQGVALGRFADLADARASLSPPGS